MDRKPKFFCNFCGSEVPRNTSRCPSCGRIFSGIQCPQCGFEGEPSQFKTGCPNCGYLKGKEPTQQALPERPEKSTSRRFLLILSLVLGALLLLLLIVLLRI